MKSNIYFQEEGKSFLVARCIENLPNFRKPGLEWQCCHFLLIWWEASGWGGAGRGVLSSSFWQKFHPGHERVHKLKFSAKYSCAAFLIMMKKHFIFLHEKKTQPPPCSSCILHASKHSSPTIALFCMQAYTHFPLLLFVKYFE